MRAGLIMAAVIWLVLFIFASHLLAHDAIPTAAQPNGWTYPFSCCSGVDCYEVPDSAIRETPKGYQVTQTGELVPYVGSNKLRNSPDGKFHRCSKQGKADTETLCIFVPPRGY